MDFISILNKAVLTAHAAAGRTFASDPLQSFMYKVQIEGMPVGAGFQKVSGISREVEVIEYFENLYNHAHKLPGRESVGDITFERGMFANDSSLKDFYTDIFTNQGAVRQNVVIQITDRWGNIRKTYNCCEAWFSKYEVSDLDSSSSDVIIETLTMSFEYFG